MKIERTHDMVLVNSVLLNEKIRSKIIDDGTKDVLATDNDAVFWLAVYDDKNEFCGLYFLHPVNSVCYEMHTCLLPNAWGATANKLAQCLLSYAFEVMKVKKIVTNVPESNRLALNYAKRNGMVVEGVNRESFLKNGILEDLVMLGITFKEWESCQQYQH